jgi:hypothetical protein
VTAGTLAALALIETWRLRATTWDARRDRSTPGSRFDDLPLRDISADLLRRCADELEQAFAKDDP